MNLQKLVRNFFGFSRQESNGFLILVPIMLLILFSEPFYSDWARKKSEISTTDKILLDSLVSRWNAQPSNENSIPTNRAIRRFAFDPNTASKEELMELGFTGTLATRIQRYLEKGGRFRVKSDLLKIYGMDSSVYQAVEPLILLPELITKEKRKEVGKKLYPKVKAAPAQFDINTADTSQLKKIYGIGEKLSVRIVKYRESLGGFIRQEQVGEVYGLDTMAVQNLWSKAFVAHGFQPKKINLNLTTEEELDRHPYLTRQQAKAILAYRFQHGDFRAVEDIQKIHLLEKGSIEKISPYLTVD